MTDKPIFAADTQVTHAVLERYIEEKTFALRPAEYATRFPKWPGAVGLEIEMLPLTAPTSTSRPRVLHLHDDTPQNLTRILLDLAKEQGWTPKIVPSSELLGAPDRLFSVKLDDQDQLTFEPGAQLEFSSRPYPCLEQAYARMIKIQSILDAAFKKAGVHLTQLGMNAWQSPDEVGLQMPKARYRAMTDYFNRLSPFGIQMMRLTGTVQVNLDFGHDEATLAKRYLASQLIAPFTTAIFGNSPFSRGKAGRETSLRSRTWQNLDSSRTGFPKLETVAREMSAKACRDSYRELVLGAQVIFAEVNHECQIPDGRFTFSDWISTPFAGRHPTIADLETHMSLLFPEVRARGFLELRSVDCQSRAWQGVPAAYYTGLLYDPKALDTVVESYRGILKDLNQLWWACSLGLSDDRLAKGAAHLMSLAQDGFSRLPECFKGAGLDHRLAVFKENFTDKRLTPAHFLVEAGTAATGGHLDIDALRRLDDKYQAML